MFPGLWVFQVNPGCILSSLEHSYYYVEISAIMPINSSFDAGHPCPAPKSQYRVATLIKFVIDMKLKITVA